MAREHQEEGRVNNLEQQIRDDLAHVHEQPVPGERDIYLQDTQHEALRDAILLLARHVQRHDALVTLQRDIDGYCEDRRMPDDALDSFEAQRDALRREIWDEVAGRLADGELHGAVMVDLCAEFGRWCERLTAEQLANVLARWGFVSRDELTRAESRIEELEAEVAEHRRHVAAVMQREGALRKRAEELEHERYVSRVKGWGDEYEQDADAALGRAIREMDGKPGCDVTLKYCIFADDTRSALVCWTNRQGLKSIEVHGPNTLLDVIRAYNKEED